MTTKTKVAITTAAACAAIGGPVFFQQREIQSLREENALLRAPVPPRRNTPAPPAMSPVIAFSPDKSAAQTAGADRTDDSIPITERTRRLGNRRVTDSESGGATPLGGAAPPTPLGQAERERTTLSVLHLGEGEAASIEALGELSGTRTVPMIAGKIHWDHAQATGAPDTLEAGDKPTAWAPQQTNSGEQWLQLDYDKAVELKEVNIHETYNPGAISKVAARMPDGSEKVLWQGTAVKPNSSHETLETSVPVPPGITSSQIKIYVDTGRVGSWPEIDAVEVVGTSGTRQWASSSSASSSYSANYTDTVLTTGGRAAQTIIQAADGRVMEVRAGAATSP